METKKHPAWKNAMEMILNRFDEEGYGIMFSSQNLLDMLDMEKPNYGSFDEFQNFQLERLNQIESLKSALLEDSNLCLENSRGNGYMIMHPNDQVSKTSDKYYRQSRKKINRMISVLTCVDSSSLSQDGQQKQINMLGRAAFIKAAMNKRKVLPTVEKKGITA